MEEDLRKWKKLPCSWVGRINIVKMEILPKAIYRSITVPINILTQFFIELERAILKFIWNNKQPRIAKTIINSKRTSGGINIPDHKQYYGAVMLKTASYWYSDREVDQSNSIEDPELIPHTFDQLIFDKNLKTSSVKKIAFSTNDADSTGGQHAEE